MSHIISATVGGLRGPGLTGADRTLLDNSVERSEAAAGQASSAAATVDTAIDDAIAGPVADLIDEKLAIGVAGPITDLVEASINAAVDGPVAELIDTKIDAAIVDIGVMETGWPRRHLQWGLRITATQSGNVRIAEWGLRNVPGGPTLATDRTRVFASAESGPGAAQGLVDGTPERYQADADPPVTIGYRFATGTEINEFALTAPDNPAGMPTSGMWIYREADNAIWADAWPLATPATWIGGETRVFLDPLYGQAGKSLVLASAAGGKPAVKSGENYTELPFAYSDDVEDIVGRAVLPLPIPSRRLKAGLLYGEKRIPPAVDPIQVSQLSGVSTIVGGVKIAPRDTRVQLLGGRYRYEPFYDGLVGTAIQVTTDETSLNRAALGVVIEALLPANVNAFELFTRVGGSAQRFTVDLDGVRTNAAGYSPIPKGDGDGDAQYLRIVLPAGATKPRRVRVWTPSKMYRGLILPAGTDVLDAAPVLATSMVFVGDSITEASQTETVSGAWAIQVGERLGVNNPINIGIGSSGYLAFRPNAGGAGINGPTFRQHIDDVLKAVDGSPPDAVVIAGGINDANNYTAQQIGAEALLYFQQLRAGAPRMKIIVIGPFSGDGVYTDPANANLIPARDAIFAAAEQVSNTFTIDVAAMFSNPARSTWYGADKVHPNQLGHDGFADFLAPRIEQVVALGA